MRAVRGAEAAMIFQEPMTSLNPVQTVGAQVVEAIRLHERVSAAAARARCVELFDRVGIPDAGERFDSYPHQLSGGLKQRVMIAMALSMQPKLLIADEPTTALDVTIQAQILELLREIRDRFGMAILLISHNLGVVNELADRVAVMYAGQVAEQGTREELLAHPRHPYTQRLLASIPSRTRRGEPLAEIPGVVPSPGEWPPGCRFTTRCHRAFEPCAGIVPGATRALRTHSALVSRRGERGAARVSRGEVLLRVEGLRTWFPIRKGVFRRTVGHVRAVDGVDLEIRRGETLALVGESGCGKTTVGRSILRLVEPTRGPDLVRRRRPRAALARGAAPVSPRDPDRVPGSGRLARPAHARARRGRRGHGDVRDRCLRPRANRARRGGCSSAFSSIRARCGATRTSSRADSASASASRARSRWSRG